MVLAFAIVGGLIAAVPFASFILIPMEWYLVYTIAQRHRAFELAPFAGVCAAIFTISAFLKGLATFLHFLVGIGQLANMVVAFVFILIIGNLAEKYYAGKAR